MPPAAKAYLKKHDFIAVLQTMLDEVLYTTPEQPYDSLVVRLSQYAQDAPVFSMIRREKCSEPAAHLSRIQVVLTVRGMPIIAYEDFVALNHWPELVGSEEAEVAVPSFSDVASEIGVALQGVTAVDVLRIPQIIRGVSQRLLLPPSCSQWLRQFVMTICLKAFAFSCGMSVLSLLQKNLLAKHSLSHVGASLRNGRDFENFVCMGKTPHLVQVVDSTHCCAGSGHVFSIGVACPLDVRCVQQPEELSTTASFFDTLPSCVCQDAPLSNAVMFTHEILNRVSANSILKTSSCLDAVEQITKSVDNAKIHLENIIGLHRGISCAHGILFCNGDDLWISEKSGYSCDGGITVMTGLELVDFYVDLYQACNQWIKVFVQPFRVCDIGYLKNLLGKVPQLEIAMDFGVCFDVPSVLCEGFGYVSHCTSTPFDMVVQHSKVSESFQKPCFFVSVDDEKPNDMTLQGLLSLPAKYWSLSKDFIDAGGVQVLDAQWYEFFCRVLHQSADLVNGR